MVSFRTPPLLHRIWWHAATKGPDFAAVIAQGWPITGQDSVWVGLLCIYVVPLFNNDPWHRLGLY